MRGSDRATEPKVRRLHRRSKGYPKILKTIDDPPELLYARGEVPSAPGIAVVGSRECTEYGRRIAYRLAAHRGALDGGGKTVAVLPTAIDDVYPRGHVRLAERIARCGALLTEFASKERVYPSNFQQRNRIIAGLAAATVVVEAAHKSGAKITVKFALEYNREVLAVPGPVGSPTSAGANSLIAEGAAVCTGIDSLLRQLPDTVRAQAAPLIQAAREVDLEAARGLDTAGRAVLAAMPDHASCGVDYLAAATSLPVGELLAALTDIEVRGLIRSVGNQRYERV